MRISMSLETEMKFHRIVLMCTVLALTGCAADNVKLVGRETSGYTNYDVPAGTARIYFANGIMLPDPDNKKYVNRYRPKVFINGTRVGQVQKTEVMVIDVPPGEYSVSWSTGKSFDSTAPNELVQLKVGDFIILRGNYEEGFSGAFGLIGLAIDSAKGTQKNQLERVKEKIQIDPNDLVLPSSCPDSICKK